MPIYGMERDGDTVIVQADVTELTAEMIDDHETGVEAHCIAGLTVTKVGDGQHDGQPARVFTLSDNMGTREMGRLVLRLDAGQEELFEWTEIWADSKAANLRVAEWKVEQTAPLATATQDFCWDGYDSLEHGMAATSAAYGVSVGLTGVPTGNSWPEISITGLRANVRRCLKDGWQMTDAEIAAVLN